MRFIIEFTPESLEDLKSLPKEFGALVKRAISQRLETEPLKYGKPLRGSLHGLRTLRVSKYRVIYEVIEVKALVLVVKIDIRRDVYEE